MRLCGALIMINILPDLYYDVMLWVMIFMFLLYRLCYHDYDIRLWCLNFDIFII